ncbi:hypothetical protein SXIM_26450 [Streptomyces xiamenensis]|uniref:Uncharacterized protein n=1 Tax=Streptomyces xiamenensis TaxID=408015 RepID=A0A0F7FV33_9ACTN|nr:hypothetical protein [Streptomyces xiamenensis]AKG44029.1 hypothetical protein SXIM_26450 [Streptomyces xiamenensis]
MTHRVGEPAGGGAPAPAPVAGLRGEPAALREPEVLPAKAMTALGFGGDLAVTLERRSAVVRFSPAPPSTVRTGG